jgi:prepilin peptidase CpaA
MTAIEAGALAPFAVSAVAAVWLDVSRRCLPNWLCAMVWLAGLGFAAATVGWAGAGSALLHSLLALAVGMALFGMRMIGGGDAKYYAANAAWFPLSHGAVLLFAVGLAGLVLTLILWIPMKRRAARRSFNDRSADPFAKLPFGVAIAAGGLASFAWFLAGG